MLSLKIGYTLSLIAVLTSFSDSTLADDAIVQTFGDWTVTIQPGPRGGGLQGATTSLGKTGVLLVSQSESDEADVSAAEDAPATDLPVVIPRTDGNPLALAGMYAQIYNQIPFNRAEYMANPSYRHDATMEILFGKMRPTVIHRGSTAHSHTPVTPAYYPPAYSPYGFNSYYYPFYYGYPGYGWLQPASLW